MKKILIIILAISPFISNSQCIGIADIWKTNADTVFLGDTAWVDVWAYDGYYDPYCVDYFHLTLNNGTLTFMTIKYCDWNKTYPKKYDQNPNGTTSDSTVRYYFVVPDLASLGNNVYYGKCTTKGKFVYIKSKEESGINEYSTPKKIKEIHYYNIVGQEIQKPSESTSGLVICRILYNTGETNVTKKYYTNIY